MLELWEMARHPSQSVERYRLSRDYGGDKMVLIYGPQPNVRSLENELAEHKAFLVTGDTASTPWEADLKKAFPHVVFTGAIRSSNGTHVFFSPPDFAVIKLGAE